jgi:hypothetical protein
MALPKLKYFIQCDEIRNDNGKFSAVGIFDTIFSFIYPATHKRFYILLGFIGVEGQFGIEIQFSGPDGHQIAKANGEINATATDQVVNTVFSFENFPLPLEGRYTVSMFLDGDFFAEHHFRVQPPFQSRERTPEEIATLLQQPDIIKSANVDVGCDKCKTIYRFQVQLDSNAPIEQGFLHLPPGDEFACSVCGRRIPIAQVRRNMDNILGIPRQWLGTAGGPQQAGGGAPPQAQQT